VVVKNADNASAQASQIYTVLGAPSLSAVVPNAVSNAGGSTLSIVGSNFLPGTTATIDGLACSAPSLQSSTTLLCTVPSSSKTSSVDVASPAT
jgi:hypothetical protein